MIEGEKTQNHPNKIHCQFLWLVFIPRKRRIIRTYSALCALSKKEKETAKKPCRLTQALIIYLFGTGDKSDNTFLHFKKNEIEKESESEHV